MVDRNSGKGDGVGLLPINGDSVKDTLSKQPCMRSALMCGIAGGLGVGLIQFKRKGSVLSAYNWSMGSFVAIASVGWPMCLQRQLIGQRRSQVFVEAIKTSTDIDQLEHNYAESIGDRSEADSDINSDGR